MLTIQAMNDERARIFEERVLLEGQLAELGAADDPATPNIELQERESLEGRLHHLAQRDLALVAQLADATG